MLHGLSANVNNFHDGELVGAGVNGGADILIVTDLYSREILVPALLGVVDETKFTCGRAEVSVADVEDSTEKSRHLVVAPVFGC